MQEPIDMGRGCVSTRARAQFKREKPAQDYNLLKENINACRCDYVAMGRAHASACHCVMKEP